MTDRARKKREVSLSGYFTDEEEEGFPEDELAETLFGVPQTPEEEYLKNAAVGRAGQALSELPLPQREVFEKTELHGYSIKMLAEETGPANRRCYPASTRRCCFCARGCGISMMP